MKKMLGWIDPKLPTVMRTPPVVDSDLPPVHYQGTKVTMTAHTAIRYKLTCGFCHHVLWGEYGEDLDDFEKRTKRWRYEHVHGEG